MHNYIWSPSDIVTVLAALSALVVSVINALKNTATETRGDDNQQRINTLAQHLQNHDQQLTTLALSIPPAAASATASGFAPMPEDMIAPQSGAEDKPQ